MTAQELLSIYIALDGLTQIEKEFATKAIDIRRWGNGGDTKEALEVAIKEIERRKRRI